MVCISYGTPPPGRKFVFFLRQILKVGSVTEYGYQLTRLNALRQMTKACRLIKMLV